MENFGETMDGGKGFGRHGGASATSVNHYAVLGVDPTASRLAIREAYLRLKGTYAGDSSALYSLVGEDEAQAQLAAVEDAYRVLSDDVARREHDLVVGAGDGGARGLGRQAPPLDDFDAASVTVAPDLGTERLLLARGVPIAAGGGQGFAPSNLDAVLGGAEGSVVRTTRSTLPIIKLKACEAGSEEMKRRMQALIEAGDPGDGDLYRRLRETCGVSEDELQERTKVCVSYLRAIEANRFDRLPQAVYVKGFLRSFFRYLAVPDAEKLVAAFSARLADWQANRKS